MVPSSRQQFKDYCLRKLGYPVIKINVSNEQIDDRVDEALAVWRDWHHTATNRTYLKHKITDEDKENRYVTVPENVLEVVRVLPLGLNFSGNIFSSLNYAKYRVMLQYIWSMSSQPIASYVTARQHLETLDEQLGNKVGFRFNRHDDKIHIDTTWELLVKGEFLVFECYTVQNASEVWGDHMLQKIATAYIKKQWGEILSKFNDVQLMNGVTFSGSEIKQDAMQEIENLIETMRTQYRLPPLGVIA